MLRRGKEGFCRLPRFSTAVRRRSEDESDWLSSEWWGSASDNGQTVLRYSFGKGNGIVSVVVHPSSRPSRTYWSKMERWLQQRCEEVHPRYGDGGNLRVLGNQWRVLRFNDVTHQSTAKVMATYHENKPEPVYLMQQPHCLVVPCFQVTSGSSGHTNAGQGLWSKNYENQPRNTVFSSALLSPIRRSLQHYQISDGGYSTSGLSVENGNWNTNPNDSVMDMHAD